MTVHIFADPVLAGVARSSGVDGQVAVWAESWYDGPVPANCSAGDLRSARSEFFSHSSTDAAWIKLVSSLRKTATDLLTHADGLIVWAAPTLHDCLCCLELFDAQRETIAARITETHRIPGLFSIPSRHRTQDIEPLYLGRELLSREVIRTYADGWQAFRQPSAEHLEAYVKSFRGEDPLGVLPAFRRFLQELPSTHNGFSKLEEWMVKSLIDNPMDAIALRAKHMDSDDTLLADIPTVTFCRYLERLEAGLILVREDANRFAATNVGQKLLAEGDLVAEGKIGRWLGAYQLSRDETRWRWDIRHDCVVKANH